MRIGVSRPRINGVGDTFVAPSNLENIINQSVLAYQLGQYGDMTPEQVQGIINQEVVGYCTTFPTSDDCAGKAPSLVSEAVGIMQTTAVPQQPAQTQYSYQAPNALDRVTPQTSLVTMQQGGSALSPPQQPAPVQTTQAAGSDALGMKPGDENVAPPYKTDWMDFFFTGSGFGVPNWLVTVGLGIGVYMLVGNKGK